MISRRSSGSQAGDGPVPWPGSLPGPGSGQSASRRLNVNGVRRPFPKETQSALDIEGKHVTIQGPSPDLSPATTLAPLCLRDFAAKPSDPLRCR
jgi:hypothetical protein